MNTDSTMAAPRADELGGFAGRVGEVLGAQWTPAQRKCIARAPGRLDIMGGIAEYTGSLVLAYPVARSVLVGVAPRNDQNVSIALLRHQRNGDVDTVNLPLSILRDQNGKLASPQTIAGAPGIADDPGCLDLLAPLYALLADRRLPDLRAGLTIAVRSDLAGLEGVARRNATSVATLLAVSTVFDLPLKPMELAGLVQTGQNLLCNRAQHIADSAAAGLAQPDKILQIRCRTREILGQLPIPPGVALSGVDCGARCDNAAQKYIDVRTAAFMGRNLIERILSADSVPLPNWDGHLCQLTLTDYVERLRDRLPTKIKGADFLERFGETGDPLTRINPDKVYKIRSRTEHHIYENTRSFQFAERLARAARTHDRNALIEAGELMYASHWSYGQRCGLGSIETDRLVNLLRSRGVDAGIYGAKTSGRGCGGTVVVLHADTDHTREAISAAVDEYASMTELRPQLLNGTSAGACVQGVHQA